MGDFNKVNGTGENKMKSCKEKSSEVILSPKAGEQKSPKKFICDESQNFDLESSKFLHEEISEDKHSESFGEDRSEKVKLLAKDSQDEDKHEKDITKLSLRDTIKDEIVKTSSPKSHLSEAATVPAEKTVAKQATEDRTSLESAEKRKPRLNRRGFHLHGASLDNLVEPKSEKTEKCTEVHAPKGKIISLTSVKKTTAVIPTDTKKILLKRKLSLSAEEEEKSEPTKATDDPPKKKKYKPITWP